MRNEAKEEVLEMIGQLNDRFNSFKATLSLRGVPDHIHIAAMREAFPQLQEDLQEIHKFVNDNQ